MKTILKIDYAKPRDCSFSVYQDKVRIKNKKETQLKDSGELTLVEDNVVLSRFWWLYFIFQFVVSLFGVVDDWKDTRRKVRTVVLNYENLSPKLTVKVGANAKNITLAGAEHFAIVSDLEAVNPKIDKRIAGYKKVLITSMLTIVFIIFLALAITFLLK